MLQPFLFLTSSAEPSKRDVNPQTHVSAKNASISCVLVVETKNSVPFVSIAVTSHGDLRVFLERPVSLSSPTILPTMNLSEQTRSQNLPAAGKGVTAEEDTKKSKSIKKRHAERVKVAGKVESAMEKQFEAGRVYAVVASRPGQSGRCDGYILEDEELAFYQRAIRK